MDDLISGVLNILNVPYYFGTVLFAGEPPPIYVVYSYYDYPVQHGDGAVMYTNYVVTFSVYGRDSNAVDRLYRQLLPLLLEQGFTWAGCHTSMDNHFPAYHSKIIDFNFIKEFDFDE